MSEWKDTASAPFGPASDQIVPIALRADLNVYIAGLPADLTPAEAAKIGRVVMALSVPGASPAGGSSDRLEEPNSLVSLVSQGEGNNADEN